MKNRYLAIIAVTNGDGDIRRLEQIFIECLDMVQAATHIQERYLGTWHTALSITKIPNT